MHFQILFSYISAIILHFGYFAGKQERPYSFKIQSTSGAIDVCGSA